LRPVPLADYLAVEPGRSFSMSNAELRKIFEPAENLQQPQNYGNYDYGIQDSLDLTLHRYEPVQEPK
jgi:hypothetical protein